MASSTRTANKPTIPSPLPYHRGSLSIPDTLKTSVTSALSTSGAIPRIQSSMQSSLDESFMPQLEAWLERAYEQQPGLLAQGDEPMLEKVLGAPREGADGLEVSEEAVQQIVRAVRGEVERCCVVVEGDEWVG